MKESNKELSNFITVNSYRGDYICLRGKLSLFTLGSPYVGPDILRNKDRVPTNRKTHVVYTLYHAVIARKYIWVKQNVSFAHV